MLIVTGTKRSGTSLCMQLVQALGYSVVGKAFPGEWGKTIRAANEGGFFESYLRRGIHFGTNPHPKTGRYLHPDDARNHALKIFAGGFVKTHRAFIGSVLMTMRPWNEYVTSLSRLSEMEATSRSRPFEPRSATMSALEWWHENFVLVRDLNYRRFPHHLTTFTRVLRDPLRELKQWTGTIALLGAGREAEAAELVQASRRSQKGKTIPAVDIEDEHLEIFQALYNWCDRGGTRVPAMTPSLLKAMERTQRALIHRSAAVEAAKNAPKTENTGVSRG